MRTAEEMYQYCLDNDFGKGVSHNWGIKHFGVIEANLQSDETVQMVFIGLHNYVSSSKHEGICAYVITDRRLIIGQKKLIGDYVKIVLLNMLNDVSAKSGALLGVIEFDTIKETLNICVNKKYSQNILNRIHEVLFQAKSEADNKAGAQKSKVEELKGIKQLFDDGILTQEEFDAEKAKILKG